ncbi:hypothetical protein NL676_008946 [Syzygium grande]|nr:hypothetical protein NL676_008946 [Syzygium grande]
MPEDCHGKGPESSPVNSASSTSGERGDSSKDKNPHKPRQKVCHYWISGNCVRGDACPFLHSRYHGVDFAMLAKLDGHKKGVFGIALPSGSTKLYAGSKDGTARIWDCHTGKCDQVINLGGEVGCFTCEGPWVFIGLPNTIQAWNIQNGASYDISGPVGQVHAMEVAKNMLFAGAQDGTVMVWKGGSIDRTIRVWDLHTLECVQELVGHTDVVMSLLCWDEYLISCSLDQTVKVWGIPTGGGSLEVAYTHHEDHGILALSHRSLKGEDILKTRSEDSSDRSWRLILHGRCRGDADHLEIVGFSKEPKRAASSFDGVMLSRRENQAMDVGVQISQGRHCHLCPDATAIVI